MSKRVRNGLRVLVVSVSAGLLSLAAPAIRSDPAPPAAASASTPPPIELALADLVRGYATSQPAMQDRIGGRPVRTGGEVQAVDTDLAGSTVLALNTGNPYMPARLRLAENSPRAAVTQLGVGQRVELVCERVSYVMGGISGSGCRLP